MMCRPLVRVASFAVLASTAFAGDVKPAKDGWTSYGVGTSVTMKTTSKTTTAMPDAPAAESVAESRMTLTAKTDNDYTLKSESKVGEEWMGTDVVVPRAPVGEVKPPEGTKIEELGDESVNVGGTAIACKKQRVTVGPSVTTSWTNDKYGVVKSESKGGGAEMTIALTKLSKMVKVGGKDVDCRETTTISKTAASEKTIVTLVSDAVPGMSVRTETTSKMPAAQMTMMAVMEVTAFEIK